jgi:uncharacterized protein (TIGR04141 family)
VPTIPNHRDLPARDLTIYLLQEAVTEDQVAAKLAGCTEHRIAVGRTTGRLFSQAVRNNAGPKWAALFEDQVDRGALGLVASVSAVFLIRTSGRLFAFTFGAGRFLLDDDWFEERFGFYAVLNLVDANQIRSVDKKSLDAIGRQTRVQTTRGATVRDFGVDYERDLLRAVVGTPREEDLGTRVVGATALHASVRIDLANLQRLLAKYYDQSRSHSYRRKFPGIDQLRPVTDEDQMSRLNARVIQALNDGDVDAFSLAVPDIIDWQQVSVFRYEGLRDATNHYELNVRDLLRLATDAGHQWSAADLNRIRIGILDADGNARERWALRKCLFGQLRFQGKQWVLSSGLWYSVAEDLVAEVDEAFNAIERLDGLPHFDHETEAEYCRHLSLRDGVWALMDRRPITFGGGRSSVEFCDLFSRGSSTLLHVKRYAGSGPLSHLFQQALVSGETFRTVPEFRRLVNEKLPHQHQLADWQPTPQGFRVALGIVRPGDLTLPFFSKVTLRNTVRLLRGFDFNVVLAHIDVGQARARAAVARRRRGH